MTLSLITGPSVEPISLAEAKDHLRVDQAHEDDLITSLIASARAHVEAAAHLALNTQTWRLYLDDWPDRRVVSIPVGPLQSVDVVTVYGLDGSPEIVPPSDYEVDTAARPGRVRLSGASNPGRDLNGIEIDVTAGFGNLAGDVPEPLRHAIRILVAHWYDARGAGVGSDAAGIPPAAEELLFPFHQVRL